MTDKLKLLPREATREMLEAMDECSKEGYDERLYAGHAGSVYMAAWDAFHGQHCYCGDITNLGVIHRDDGPCHYPDHKETEQEPVACVQDLDEVKRKHLVYEKGMDWKDPLYTTPPQRTWVGLTEEEVEACFHHVDEAGIGLFDFAEAIEAKLKKKNTK